MVSFPPPFKSLLDAAAGTPAIGYHALTQPGRARLAELLARVRRACGAIGGIVLQLPGEDGHLPNGSPTGMGPLLDRAMLPLLELMKLAREERLEAFACVGPTTHDAGRTQGLATSVSAALAARLIGQYASAQPNSRGLFPVRPNLERRSGRFRKLGTPPRGRIDRGGKSLRAALRRELARRSSVERHIIYREWKDLPETHAPLGVFDPQRDVPMARCAGGSARRRAEMAGLPMIDTFYEIAPQRYVAELALRTEEDVFLSGHQVDGVPVLPAVVGTEICVEALQSALGYRIRTLCQLEFVNRFAAPLTRPYRARLEIDATSADVRCSLRGEFFNAEGQLTDTDRLYHRMIYRRGFQIPPVNRLWNPPQRREEIDLPAGPEVWKYPGGTVHYGEEFRRMTAVAYGEGMAWGRFIAGSPDGLCGARWGRAWQTPATLFDSGLILCDLFSHRLLDTRLLPVSVAAVAFGEIPRAGEELIAQVLMVECTHTNIVVDVRVQDAAGCCVVDARGCNCRRLRS